MGPEVAHGALGLAVNLAFGWVAWRVGSLDRAGLVAGVAIGGWIWFFAGARGWLLLALFVLLAGLATRTGYRRKRAAGLAEPDGGRRSAPNVLANGLVAAWFAAAWGLSGREPGFLAAFVASLGAATGDTLSSEIGQLTRGATRSFVGWRRVEPGEDGGVSWLGTAAGVAGCAAIVVVACRLWDLPHGQGVVTILAALAGIHLDSLLGATLERRGAIGNETVNLAATAGAALLACLGLWATT